MRTIYKAKAKEPCLVASPTAFLHHPAAAATLALSAASQACELGWDALVNQATMAWSSGHPAVLPSFGLVVLSLAPGALAPVRRRAQAAWRAALLPRAALGAEVVRGRIDLAADAGDSLCALAMQGAVYGAALDDAPRAGLVCALAVWAGLAGLALARGRQAPEAGRGRGQPAWVGALEASAASAEVVTHVAPLVVGALSVLQARAGLAPALNALTPFAPPVCDALALAGPAMVLSARLPRISRHLHRTARALATLAEVAPRASSAPAAAGQPAGQVPPAGPGGAAAGWERRQRRG